MDRLTLFAMQGGLLVFMGIVVFVVWWGQRRERVDNGAVWFATGFVLGGVGLYLQAYRGIISPFFAIIMGNFLFLMNYVCMEKALAITTKRRSRMYWMLAMSIALILNFAYYTYVKPDVILRTIEAVIFMPIMQAFVWAHTIRSKDKTIRRALHAMAIVLLIHMLMNFVRIYGVLKLHHADAWFSWFGVLSIAGLSLSFLWIDALRIREELEQRAMTDPLTGLLNRRALEEYAMRELSRAARNGLPCSALAIDINQFKMINDTYGHAAGDTALVAVAGALRSSLRTTDLATRVGGDEFFVLLPDSDELAADVIATRLRSTIHQLKLETFYGEQFQISISVGMVTKRGEKMTVADLFHASDIMLYREKQGRNSIGVVKAKPDQPSTANGGAHVHPSKA